MLNAPPILIENLDTFKDIWGQTGGANIPLRIADLDTFKDIWGLLCKLLSFSVRSHLDTFKDIWGPLMVEVVGHKADGFRYLQGYMGTLHPSGT